MFRNTRRVCVSVVLLVAAALPCAAQENFLKKVGRHFGKLEWSESAFMGANVADAWTSSRPGLIETNPLLAQHGQFTAVSAAIKLSLAGAQIFGQHYILKHRPEYSETHHLARTFTIVNYAGAGLYGIVAAHNASLK